MDEINKPKISVIIPMYNVEDYIKVCIQSVLNQTYQTFEIICIDDGSIDKSADVVREIMCKDSRIKLYEIENHGQGYARNMALNISKGEYIMFLDADDYIEPVTFEVCIKRLEEELSDFVVFDWRYYNPINQKSTYKNKDEFFSEKTLIKEECYRLFKISPIFSVNKIYRKKYLMDFNIKFDEGYIYEDNPFWVKVVINARKVSLIHSPLYRITINHESSTSTKYDTDWHCTSFLKAIKSIITLLKESNFDDKNCYYLYTYLLKKFRFYLRVRTPKQYQMNFKEEFLELFSKLDNIEEVEQHKNKFYTYCIKFKVWQKRRIWIFSLGCFISNTCIPKYHKLLSLAKKKIKSILLFLKKVKRKLTPRRFRKKQTASYGTYVKQPLYQDVILFAGFDYRYTGNSRYLFEEMIQQNHFNKKIFFITDDVLVPLEYRIKPNSDRAKRFLARSKTIIFESWIPLWIVKRDGMKWIQLWHGTPLKKMLFDSNEKYITEKRPMNKINKYNDIVRWDYLICDNKNVSHLFETSFLFPKNKIILSGYPRVKYLLSHINDTRFRSNLKKKIGISEEKKIILYLPTWRDYNYDVDDKNFDLNYLLDLNELQKKLGDKFEIIYKDHVYLSKPENVDFKNFYSCETQELLLVADYLITDYSSVMFDAFAIDLPVIIYANDYEKNEEARGVYNEIWNLVKSFDCKNINDICELINKYSYNDKYFELKNKYSYSSESNLIDIITKKSL